MSLNLYDYDLPEHVIFINNWAHLDGASWNADFEFSEGFSDERSLLINGMGIQVNANLTHQTPIAEFYVQPNRRYRFRLINIVSYSCPTRFSIDNHNLTIIASDGHLVDPVEVESIVTSGGN